ncbi:putative membrane protein [Campylobacter blaseri]|uniref:Uncharacterized protein n=1 Tax=Campylobacter blaseri TaxID=2042961 RepID=A0A2P8R3B6_9BACT|nr:hypothetical protein CQ405_00070 [Campylobacter blaseri]PSM54457.1 hypothetical protein CRN67_00070 [Campylobacter blaseri]QKF85299.1 putative membrane protein [Campylobacter blaseri]
MTTFFNVLDIIRIIVIIGTILFCISLWINKKKSFGQSLFYFAFALFFHILIPTEDIYSIGQLGEPGRGYPFYTASVFNLAFFVFIFLSFIYHLNFNKIKK